MKFNKEFNKYLANMSVITMKLHNIHWNVEGNMFVSVHEYTDSEYNKFFERMDEVAELLKMYEIMPLSTLKEYLEVATIEEEPTRKFNCTEGLKIYLNDLKNLKKEALELRKISDEKEHFEAVAMLEEHISDYNKQIWFISATIS